MPFTQNNFFCSNTDMAAAQNDSHASVSFQNVWLVPTRFGDAIRMRDELVDVLDNGTGGSVMMRRLGAPVSGDSIIPVTVPRVDVRTAPFLPSDLPDASRSVTEVCNVCGYVAGFSVVASHPAWRAVRSTLGCFKEAYTLRGGNMIFLRGKTIFKGAVSFQGVRATVLRLLAEPREPVLRAYLVIATAYLRRNVFVHNGCLLEEMLSRLSWCRVMRRHEEMSNAIIFYINDWVAFPMAGDASEGRSKPDMGTVTVSRRGVVNVRLGWHDGVEWTGNDAWIRLVDAIRDCLLELC